MQKKRLADMREHLSNESNEEKQISFFYYMKKLKIPKGNKNSWDFIALDKKCKFLKYTPQKTLNYIAIGGISGVQRFIKPNSCIKNSFKLNLNSDVLNQMKTTKCH